MKITHWRLIVTKLKAKFIYIDYKLELFKKLLNIKKKDIYMKYYVQSGHREISKEKVV